MPLQAELADLRPAKEFTTHRQPSTDSRQLRLATASQHRKEDASEDTPALASWSTAGHTLSPRSWTIGQAQTPYSALLTSRGPVLEVSCSRIPFSQLSCIRWKEPSKLLRVPSVISMEVSSGPENGTRPAASGDAAPLRQEPNRRADLRTTQRKHPVSTSVMKRSELAAAKDDCMRFKRPASGSSPCLQPNKIGDGRRASCCRISQFFGHTHLRRRCLTEGSKPTLKRRKPTLPR